MRTIIAGSRTCTDMEHLLNAIKSCKWEITTIISGTAKGADRLGEIYAKNDNIPVEKFPANWIVNGKYDKSAGYKRNVEMANNAEALIALWDGKSNGTKHMLNIAKAKGLKVYLYIF